MNPRKLRIALAAAWVFAAPPAGAEEGKGELSGPIEMKSTGTPGTVAGSRTLEATATVTALDLTTREITLSGLEGTPSEETFKVDPSLQNLDRVHVGDQVVVEYVEGLLMQMQPPGEAPAPMQSAMASERGAPGGKPGGGVIASKQGTVTITAINMKNRIVVFRGPEGALHEVKAGPDVHLEKAKVGDQFVATYTEAAAIRVEPAKKAEPDKK